MNINKAGILKITVIVPLVILAFLCTSCAFNKKITGNIYYNESFKRCTKLHCPIEDCCNECTSSMLFITGKDTLQLCGERQDTARNCGYIKYKDIITCDTTITKYKNAPLSCRGNDCGLNCYPFTKGKRYKITGHFLPKSKFYSYPNFKFVKFAELK